MTRPESDRAPRPDRTARSDERPRSQDAPRSRPSAAEIERSAQRGRSDGGYQDRMLRPAEDRRQS